MRLEYKLPRRNLWKMKMAWSGFTALCFSCIKWEFKKISHSIADVKATQKATVLHFSTEISKYVSPQGLQHVTGHEQHRDTWAKLTHQLISSPSEQAKQNPIWGFKNDVQATFISKSELKQTPAFSQTKTRLWSYEMRQYYKKVIELCISKFPNVIVCRLVNKQLSR